MAEFTAEDSNLHKKEYLGKQDPSNTDKPSKCTVMKHQMKGKQHNKTIAHPFMLYYT